jgi:hypothetical protein
MIVSTGRVQCLIKWGIQVKNYPINKKIYLLIILILALGCFFCFKYELNYPHYYAQAYNEAGNEPKNEFIPSYEDPFLLATLKAEKPKQSVIEKPKAKPALAAEGTNKPFEDELYDLVGNYPIREMVPFISKHNRQIAGLIVGIAKKESDWGKHAPSKNGETCYNYWGYKSSGSRGTSMGYACFGSAEEAVQAVGGRIKHFVDKNLNTPSKMVVWKCGGSCDWDNPENVRKWIADVSVYYNKIAYKN